MHIRLKRIISCSTARRTFFILHKSLMSTKIDVIKECFGAITASFASFAKRLFLGGTFFLDLRSCSPILSAIAAAIVRLSTTVSFLKEAKGPDGRYDNLKTVAHKF